ncbi:MAG: branched-chain amino acid transport system II carrier protein [Tissierellia bacterium]|nr:branched-chain amino acid transport system II carrier protein [Tissierellia bacterium]
MKTKIKDTIIIGLALFAMFFGAGNLIFPPSLGLLNGDKWFFAMVGFMTTAIGMPVMGIIATAKAGGHLHDLSDRISVKFSKILSTLIMISIGPLLAIPRTAATTYEIAISPIFKSISPMMGSIIFFSIVLFFVLSPNKIIDRIGKILTPILFVVLLTMLLKGFIHPMGNPKDIGALRSFGNGFEEGYQTMDAFASVVFTMIIINAIKSKGYESKKNIVNMTIGAGIISAIGLMIIYGGLVYLGAMSGELLGEDTGRVELLMYISRNLWGYFGMILLSIAVALACLTTAIGLTATCGEYFSSLTKNKISYRNIVIAISLFSAIMTTVGVDGIVSVAEPLLTTIYPMLIVLIIMSLFDKYLKRPAYIGAVIGAFVIGLIQGVSLIVPKTAAILSTHIGGEASRKFTAIFSKSKDIMNLLPFSKQGFAWLLPSIILAIVFTILFKERKN